MQTQYKLNVNSVKCDVWGLGWELLNDLYRFIHSS